MTRRWLLTLAGVCAAAWLTAQPVQAQEQQQCESQRAWTIDKVGKDYLKLTGQAEVDCGDMKFFADQYIEIFSDVKRVVAVGNVLFVQGDKRIAADRADFNYGTKLGTFFHSAGVAQLGNRSEVDDRDRPGANALEVNQLGMYQGTGEPTEADRERDRKDRFGTQEPDVYFYGETIEKIGEDKYRVSKGGFTTCVQPKPRWELVSGSVILNLNRYAFLKNSLFRMKGIPILYLPLFYYPINKEDRATGILIPMYGGSTIKGQTLSNAFFWAINRSHDATLMHDWFSKTGYGYGGEYRNLTGRRSQAYLRTYVLKEHETEVTDESTGETTITPPRESYELQGNANQAFGTHLAARGRVDYFSDITVQQTYHQNVYEASRRQTTLSGSLTGNWGPYTLNGTFDRREVFFGTTSSTLTGSGPRFSASRSERPLFGSPLYFSITGDYAKMERLNKSATKTTDSGLNRMDFQPVLRFPFTHWQFLTVNSSIGYRNTYWTESREDNVQVPVPIWRRYFDMQTHLVGPVFNRIWNTPNSGYAEKFKHSVEPFLDVQKTTSIDNLSQIVPLDSVDTIIGDATRVTYGLNNRFYAKRPGEGVRGNRTPEIITVSIKQTYYTDARASQVDPRYNSSFTGTQPSKLSPVSLLLKTAPSEGINGMLRMDYDTQFNAIRTISADGIVEHGGWIQAIAGWSQRRFIEGLKGFDDPDRLDHFLNTNTTLHTIGNRFGGTYGFNYDFREGSFLQQRLNLYYNAQCCGIAWEYQAFDFSRLGTRAPVAKDRRMNFSITLAGIGGFSNFFGGMGGAPNR